MTCARALLVAAAAMLAAGCGALGYPEPRAPLYAFDHDSGKCPDHQARAGVTSSPSSQVSAALMP